MNPLVSIIICTRDHAQSLGATLHSLGQSNLPAEWNVEVIVVDNGSSDHTKHVVQSVSLPGATVRYVYEPKKGQSHARNSGIDASRGDIITFTDDDLRFPREWLVPLTEPIRCHQADAVAGGVHIAPHLLRSWMAPLHKDMVASTDRLNPHDPSDMVGANCAFSRSVLQQVPAFDPELGPGAIGFGDDTLFAYQLKCAGFRIVTRLDVSLEHHFEPERLLRHSWISSATNVGKMFAYLDHHWRHESVRFLILKYLYSQLRLSVWRLFNPISVVSQSIPGPTEIEYTRRAAKYGHFFAERRRERRYDKLGTMLKTSGA